MCVCMCVVVVFFFLTLGLKENSCLGRKGHLSTRATLGEPTFHTFSYKTWRNGYMRIKIKVDLARVAPHLAGSPFCDGRQGHPPTRANFSTLSFSSSFLTWVLSVCLSVCNRTCLLSSNPLLGTVDMLSLLTSLSERERAFRKRKSFEGYLSWILFS